MNTRQPAHQKQVTGQTPSAAVKHHRLLQRLTIPVFTHPSDEHEHAAERAADVVTRETGALPLSHLSPALARHDGVSPTSGHPLDEATRALMEPRFSHDFSMVRVHTDDRAARSAQALDARAFTTGNSIFFGASEYNPRSLAGKHLLAHELAHVVQQSRQPQRKLLQRKLKLAGATAVVNRALAILNGGLFGYAVSADSVGNISIARNGIQGPPTLEQTALCNRLNTIISDAATVTVGVGAGTKTVVGSYAAQTIDVADMEAMGVGPSGAVETLIHELVEQYEKQARGTAYGSDTTGAHGAGVRAESEVEGAARGAQRVISSSVNADGTFDAVIEIPWTYPDGRVVTVRMTIVHNNVTGVTRS